MRLIPLKKGRIVLGICLLGGNKQLEPRRRVATSARANQSAEEATLEQKALVPGEL